MGVPKFYRWISERYPQINQVITDSALLPEFDHLYLDMNGIIHGCTHPAHLDVSVQLTERDMMLGIMNYIDRIITQIVKPRVSVYMAIDGVAPRAKLNQQRSRRFRSAKDMAEQAKANDKLSGVVDKSEENKKITFDSNCITPGTEFLNKVSEHIKYFIRKKLREDPLWHGLEVLYSGPDVPGEGEHKIMQHIREMKARPNYQPNTRHCMYGQDADLIMLGLVTHEPHFTLLREVIDFNSFSSRSNRNSATEKAVKKFTKQSDFQLLHLSILREYLHIDFAYGRSKDSYDLESLIDDFVFLTFLVGNDFLPHMPSLDIGDGAFDLLFNTYKEQRQLWGKNEYLTHAGEIIDAARLEVFIRIIGEAETEILEQKEDDDAAYMKKRRKWDKRDGKPAGPTDEEIAQKEAVTNADYVTALRNLNLNGGKEVIDGWNPETGKKDFKGRYYFEKLKLLPTNIIEHYALRKSYIEGLIWCLAYYYKGCISWGWFYPYHYGPMLSDLTNLPSIFESIKFEVGSPLKPFEQLMGCLPPASGILVPRIYRNLMSAELSPILQFYPTDFEVDMNGKKNPWEGVNLLPFIDVKLLKETLKNLCPDSSITAEERGRNTRGKVFLYTHDLTCNETVPSCNREIGLLDIHSCHSKAQMLDAIDRIDLCFKPEVVPGTKIPYPGFPSLNVLPINNTELTSIGVNCFGFSSKYPTMVLHLQRLPQLPAVSVLAPRVLGQTLFINWPMMHEAKVVAISDATTEIRVNGKNKMFTDKESERWQDESMIMQQQYLSGNGVPGSGGVNINEVQIRLKVVVLQGMKTYADGSSKKIFGKMEADVPLHMALWASPAPDERFVESGPKSLSDLFPKGSNILLTKGKHKGCHGSVLSVAEDGKGSCVVAKVHVLPPEPPFGLAIAKSVQDTYVSSIEAAKLLKLNPGVFGKLTGSLLVNPGKYDLGLNLKFKKELYVLGYTRMKNVNVHRRTAKHAWTEGDSLLVVGSHQNTSDQEEEGKKVIWEYTPKALRLIAAYRQTFPQIFSALSKAPHERIYDAKSMFGPNGQNMLPKVLDWLKSIETAKLPRFPASTVAMPKNAVLAIQRAAEVRSSALSQKKSVKDVKLKLPPSAIYREGSTTATDIMTSSGAPVLGDRVANLCANGVPFGARGTVVGIHAKSGCVEVVMDEEFIGGSTLQGTCSNFRGKLCVWSHLLKTSAKDSQANVEEFAPKIDMKLPIECILPKKEDATEHNTTTAGITKNVGVAVATTMPESRTKTPTKNSTPIRSKSNNRSVSSQRKQGAWKEAMGPTGKGSGFVGLAKSRGVKSGYDAWKHLIRNPSVAAVKKQGDKSSKSNDSSTSELKALLGVGKVESVAAIPSEKSSKGREESSDLAATASLKAMIGVGGAPKVPHAQPQGPTPATAAELLAMMMHKSVPGASYAMAMPPQPHASAFNFNYVREGQEQPLMNAASRNNNAQPVFTPPAHAMMMGNVSPMAFAPHNAAVYSPEVAAVAATVPRVKKTKENGSTADSPVIVPSVVVSGKSRPQEN